MAHTQFRAPEPPRSTLTCHMSRGCHGARSCPTTTLDRPCSSSSCSSQCAFSLTASARSCCTQCPRMRATYPLLGDFAGGHPGRTSSRTLRALQLSVCRWPRGFSAPAPFAAPAVDWSELFPRWQPSSRGLRWSRTLNQSVSLSSQVP